MKIVYSARGEPPFAVEAIVEEEDTYLSMSAEPVLNMSDAHPVRVMTEARDAEEVDPGAVVVRSGSPLRFLAVVHRLNETPTWREAWVVEALENLRGEVERRGIRSLGAPLLGTVHGKMSRNRSSEFLSSLVFDKSSLERVWLITS